MKELILIPFVIISLQASKLTTINEDKTKVVKKNMVTLSTEQKRPKMKIEKTNIKIKNNKKTYITEYMNKVSENYKKSKRKKNITHNNSFNSKDKFSGKEENNSDLFNLLSNTKPKSRLKEEILEPKLDD